MKPLSSNCLLHCSFLSTCVFASSIAALLISHSAQAADAYWDATTTAGIQNTSGTWGTDSFWSTSAGTTLSAWTASDNAFFGNGSVGGEYTIALSGTQTAGVVRQIGTATAGNFTLNGGALILNGATVAIRTDHGTFTINSAITATGGRLDLTSGTTTVLGGANAFNATITQNGLGTVKLTNASALGGSGTVYAAGFTGGTSILDINGLAISGRSFRALNTFSASLLSSSTSADASWAGNIELGTTSLFSGSVTAGATGAGRSLTLSGNIVGGSGGTGTLSTISGSRLILTGATNSSTAGTTIAATSTLTVGNNTTTGALGTGGVSLTAADSALVFNRSNAITVANVISGTGTVTANHSTGAVTLSGANTYTGGTTISAGALTIGIASTRSGTTITNGATGKGNVTLADGVTLSDSNLTWYAPTMTVQGDITLTGTNRQTVGFTTLDLAGGNRTLNLNVTGGNVKQTITANTALEGTGRSRWEMQNDVGAMTVQNGNLVLATNLTGNDYAGFMFRHATSFSGNAGVTVGANVHLQTGDAGSLGSTTANSAKLTVNGIWNLNGTLGGAAGQGDQTIYSLAGSGKVYTSMVTANTNARTITLNGTSGSTDFSGEMSDGPGTGKLTISKTGASTQILSATNTYTGSTTIHAGTLIMGDAATDTFATSGVTVASGAKLGGSGTIAGTVGVTGILAPGIAGVSGGIGTLAAGGNTNWNGAASSAAATIWQFDLSANSNVADKLAITGDFTKDSTVGSTYQFDFMNSAPTTWGNVYTLVTWTGTTDFTFGDFSYTNLGGSFAGQLGTGFSIVGKSLTFTAVPEPTSAITGLLLGAGLLRRRRN